MIALKMAHNSLHPSLIATLGVGTGQGLSGENRGPVPTDASVF